MRRLFVLGIGVLVWNVGAAVIGVLANWPSQFGRVGTDAGRDVLLSGTAISAPALPMAVLVASLLLLRTGGAWSYVGVAAFTLVALGHVAGGLGELFADATPHTPRPVLVFGGLSGLAIAVTMFAVVVWTIAERRRHRPSAV